MASSRLQQHFIRLWQACQGLEQETTLEELAQKLSCSRRHMRTLLNSMQDKGWLHWQTEVGRGKRSRLKFLYTALALQQERAEDLLEQDSIEQLVQIVGDKDTVRQMLVSHIGRSFRQGRHILRVLYYRPLLNLLPGTALRRSESHIVRQIFSGLTSINEENGELIADIAHHWQQISTLHWRFYIRPGIHFHHGRELEMSDIISSLQRINTQPLFSHITCIDSPTPWTLDIHLGSEDQWLPWLLGSVNAMILPQEWSTIANFSRQPIGSGPYAVVLNNQNQLKIHAFDDYFGFRALIDEVNFWVLPETSEDSTCALHLQGMPDSEKAVESRLEEGCYYLLFDKRSPQGADPVVRQWVSYILSPMNLLYRAAQSNQQHWFPAYGMLPSWHHTPQQPAPAKPAGLKSLSLTWYHSHSEHQVISRIMATLLAEQGVELIEQNITYDEWYQGDKQSDLWLNSVNYTLPLNYSLFARLYEVPLLQKCLSVDWPQDAECWRNNTLPINQWYQKRVENRDILPLIHHWLRIEGQRSMRGMKVNTLGWFDFKSAWFAPPDP
jgi:SgrR family transcriptional regulator